MASSPNRRGVSWLRKELPGLVSNGTITAETARALERHYETSASGSRNFGFALLAIVGSALVAAGVVLLVAHNWDEFSRPLRSVIAFLPLVSAQLLSAFVLRCRYKSKAWCESAAIFNVAGIGTAISLVSQTYQIHGSLAQFVVVWLLLSLPLVYLMRTTLGAIAYLAGAIWWLFLREGWARSADPLLFWFLLALVVPFFGMLFRRDRSSHETTGLAIVLAAAAAIALGFTAAYTKTNLGVLAFAGFFAAIYICGIEFFPPRHPERLHPLALLGAVAIGAMTIVLTFEEIWLLARDATRPDSLRQMIGVLIELSFPIAALALAAWSFARRKMQFSVLAAAFPLVVGIGWLIAIQCHTRSDEGTQAPCATTASILLNVYALGLGVELIARGMRAGSPARANFGLLIIAGLGLARFFDSDLSFVARAIGFIVIGLGFLLTNLFLFKRRRSA